MNSGRLVYLQQQFNRGCTNNKNCLREICTMLCLNKNTASGIPKFTVFDSILHSDISVMISTWNSLPYVNNVIILFVAGLDKWEYKLSITENALNVLVNHVIRWPHSVMASLWQWTGSSMVQLEMLSILQDTEYMDLGRCFQTRVIIQRVIHYIDILTY